MHNFLRISLLIFYFGVCASDTFTCPQPFGYFSHPTDPHKFYECTNGEPLLISCFGNLIFNATINVCNYDPNNQTASNGTDSTICKEKDGLFIHPTEPHKFYECSNGIAKEFTCPANLIFDSAAKACNFDPNQTPTNTNDSAICKQKDGYFIHPTEPHKFYECSNGVAKEFSCPENLIFNTTINSCNYDPNQTKTNTTVSPHCLQLNGYFSDPTDARNFYECSNGVAWLFSCPGNLIFDSALKACNFDKNSNTSSTTTDSPICTQKNGHFKHPTEPHKFYECSNGVAFEFSCAANLIFDTSINACKYDPNVQTNGTANSSICVQSNGYYTHPTDSHKFYECTNGVAMEFVCPGNLIFDLTLKACNFDKTVNTTSTTTDSPFCKQKNGYFSDPTDVHKFYECDNGVANQLSCADNLIFNPTIIACTRDTKNQTSSSNSSICTLSEPHIVKHPTDSHKFYECTNGIAVEFSCPENLVFDTKVLACNFDTNIQTIANTTQSSICLTTDGVFSHPTDRHKFYICSNGLANEFVCADSLVYNSTIKACGYDASNTYFLF